MTPKQRASLRARHNTPEYRTWRSAKSKEQFSTKESRIESSKRAKKLWEDPGLREKKSASSKAQWSDPVSRAKLSKRMKEVNNCPMARAANSKRQKEFYERNPDARKARSDLRKSFFVANPSARDSVSDRFSIPIDQLDLSGNFIMTHKSAVTAGLSVGARPGTLHMAVASGNKSSGYYWVKSGHPWKGKSNPVGSGKTSPVNQLDSEGEFIDRFDKLTDAASSVNRAKSSIGFAIKNGTKSGGFRWEYAT